MNILVIGNGFDIHHGMMTRYADLLRFFINVRDSAEDYFSVFDELITSQKDDFKFTGRNRRPPLDNVNAMLSYTYTLLYHDMISALECVGLDPAVGFMHRDRPGRLSLALDLMEEFRAFFADRIVLSLINRNEVSKDDFEIIKDVKDNEQEVIDIE